jgi:DNA polymerase sigma
MGILGGFGGQNGFASFNTPKDGFGIPTSVSKTHLGIASCNLLKDYTATYPCLKEVGILLKEFLSLHDLNSAYRGK